MNLQRGATGAQIAVSHHANMLVFQSEGAAVVLPSQSDVEHARVIQNGSIKKGELISEINFLCKSFHCTYGCVSGVEHQIQQRLWKSLRH